MNNLLDPIMSLFGDKEKNDISPLNTFLTAFVPFGPLFARVFLLDGSLDKKWLMLFSFFPLSIIPALFMYFGYIKKGKQGKPYDTWMYIPIIAKFLLAFLVPLFLNLFYDAEEEEEASDTTIFLTTFIIQLVLGMIPNIIRTFNVCNQITFNSLGKAFVDSTIANSIGELLPLVLGWLPYIGQVVSIIQMIPYVGEQFDNILWGVGFFIGYVFINMINVDNMGAYCNTGFFGKDIFDNIAFIVMLCITLFVKVFNEVSPI